MRQFERAIILTTVVMFLNDVAPFSPQNYACRGGQYPHENGVSTCMETYSVGTYGRLVIFLDLVLFACTLPLHMGAPRIYYARTSTEISKSIGPFLIAWRRPIDSRMYLYLKQKEV